MLNAYLMTEMKVEKTILEKVRVLDLAIVGGLIAIFFAAAIPLTRGAIMKHRTAQCARKLQLAADAFDLYAQMMGEYPQNRTQMVCAGKVTGIFAVCDIDWWEKSTEMGGRWEWFRDQNEAFSIMICNPHVSESRMRKLDALLDDGNLRTGLFKQSGSMYCYRLSSGNV